MLWLSMAWLWFWCVVALALPLNDLLRSVRYQNAAGATNDVTQRTSQCFAKPFAAPTRVALPSHSRCDCDHKNALLGSQSPSLKFVGDVPAQPISFLAEGLNGICDRRVAMKAASSA